MISYILKGEPYPYNLDWHPPSIQHPTLTDGIAGSERNITCSCLFCDSPTTKQRKSSSGYGYQRNSVRLAKAFSELTPFASPASTTNHSEVTLGTLLAFSYVSAWSTPTYSIVNLPPSTTNAGLAFLNTLFAFVTPHPRGFLALTSPTFPRELGAIPSAFICTPVHAFRVRPSTSA